MRSRSRPRPLRARPRVWSRSGGDRSILVTWAAADDGGSAVTAYRVQWRPGDSNFADSDPQARVRGGEQSRRITGLVHGTEYFVQVMAINDVGDGPWSSPASAVAARVAGPPTSVVAVRGDRSVTVTWAAPTDTGGSDVTGYRVQWRAETQPHHSTRQATVGAASRSHEITGLTNGTKHFVRVLAVNEVDDGEPADEEPFTPATTPDAPQRVVAERGDRSILVTWAAADDGGSAVTAYRVQWRPGDSNFTDSDPQARVGGDKQRPSDHRLGQWHRVIRAGDGHQRCRRRPVVVTGLDHPRKAGGTAHPCGRGARRPVGDGHLGGAD